MPRIIGCILEQHDLTLVTLAACICVLASGTTVNLMALARKAGLLPSVAWLIAAASVFGCGVWSLHFVAMLAYTPGVPVGYDIETTIASVAIAIGGALLAFLAWRFMRSPATGAVTGGTLLGLTVAGMHYTGVGAMRLPGTLHFDPPYVAASVLTGIVFSIVGLARAGSLTFWRRAEVAAWCTLGITGSHFIGMAALAIQLGGATSDTGTIVGSGHLAIAVGSVSLAILLVGLAATYLEQHRSDLWASEMQRMRVLGDVAQEALIIQRNGIILSVNAACGHMFGVPAQHLIGRAVLDLIAAADRAKAIGHVMGRRSNRIPEPAPVEVEARAPSGALIPVEMSRAEIVYEGRMATVIALRDLSGRKRDEARIRHFAHHDALTDLPNRLMLSERLSNAIAVSQGPRKSLGLLHLDLDRFKQVNDLLGQAAGDALLVQVAERVRSQLRRDDTIARIGGDEFVVITAIEQASDAGRLASRLIDALSRPFSVGGQQVDIGVTIGIALWPDDGDGPAALMHAADTALHRAKQESRGRYVFFEAAMNKRLQIRRMLENDLRHAIERDQLLLYYQPLVSCATGELEGFEALLRWNHPERGMISPADFIPLAEETGLIVPIGEWALETACRTAMGWSNSEWVAVNVSPVQFRQPDLPGVVAATLARTGLPANRLEIEITEGVFMERVERTTAILAQIRELGVRIALDDFGTGYSSLSYLQTYAFDKLKIDKSFIDRLGQADDASTIVRTIIGLAHNLGLSIVAEGVETSRQLAIVQDYGCDQVQGYLLGRPMPMNTPSEESSVHAKLLLFVAATPGFISEAVPGSTVILS
jgi:diguanylate cyclase